MANLDNAVIGGLERTLVTSPSDSEVRVLMKSSSLEETKKVHKNTWISNCDIWLTCDITRSFL